MDTVTQGALLARKPVGGIKIGKEAGEWTASNFHPYLPSENYLTCRFFFARKHRLVNVVVGNNSFDKTVVVAALPGGVGTLDEVFEMVALIQLERIGSKLPIPFMLTNNDSFYSKLLDFLDDCENWGTVSKGEFASLWKLTLKSSVCCVELVTIKDDKIAGKLDSLDKKKIEDTIEAAISGYYFSKMLP
ncbi:hypothetical protein P8452_66512 [Trifolium repens]|nr:hypothetical protein P8452_66512 [Trifolium repens]